MKLIRLSRAQLRPQKPSVAKGPSIILFSAFAVEIARTVKIHSYHKCVLVFTVQTVKRPFLLLQTFVRNKNFKIRVN